MAIAASSLISATCSAAVVAECNDESFGHEQYQVFIDQPTGYAFIKTPCGWHFVRQIEADKITAAILIAHSVPPTPGNSVSYAPKPGYRAGVDRQNDIR